MWLLQEGDGKNAVCCSWPGPRDTRHGEVGPPRPPREPALCSNMGLWTVGQAREGPGRHPVAGRGKKGDPVLAVLAVGSELEI